MAKKKDPWASVPEYKPKKKKIHKRKRPMYTYEVTVKLKLTGYGHNQKEAFESIFDIHNYGAIDICDEDPIFISAKRKREVTEEYAQSFMHG